MKYSHFEQELVDAFRALLQTPNANFGFELVPFSVLSEASQFGVRTMGVLFNPDATDTPQNTVVSVYNELMRRFKRIVFVGEPTFRTEGDRRCFFVVVDNSSELRDLST